MPSNVENRLNEPVGALFLAAEINGLTNPFLATRIETQGLNFDFQGIIVEIRTNETVAGLFQVAIRGFEDLSVSINDSLQGLFARQEGRRFYTSTATLEKLSENGRFFRIRDFFPFQNLRLNASNIVFYLGVFANTFVNNVSANITIYGRLIDPNKKGFPLDYR